MTGNKYTRRRFLHMAGAASALAITANIIPAKAFAASALSQKYTQETRLLMGTTVTITLAGSSPLARTNALKQAFTSVEKGIAIFDRHTTSSVLGFLNNHGYIDNAPKSLVFVIEQAKMFGKASGQLFNPALLPALALFEKNSTSNAHIKIDKQALEHALALADSEKIKVNGQSINLSAQGMALTLDGIAKGYIVDIAAGVIEQSGFTNYLVNAGGDIRANGLNAEGQPWQVGISSPVHTNMTIAGGRLINKGMATSGGYERYFDASKESNHLLNPKTGKSPSLASVSVIAPTAMQADALATAASFMYPKQAMKFVESYKDSACLIVGRAGEIYKSTSWRS